MYNYPIYPRDIKIHFDKGFVDIDNGTQNGTHWTCFYVKDKKSYYFDSFGGSPDKFRLNQLPKPIIYHFSEIQDTNFKISGSYCFYFFHLIERMNYKDVVSKMFCDYLNMPMNVFGNSSNNSDNKIDTSLFVQKPYLRTNYIEAKIEEDIDLKNQKRIKKLPDPISIGEAASINYVDNLFNDPSILESTEHIDLNDRKNTNA